MRDEACRGKQPGARFLAEWDDFKELVDRGLNGLTVTMNAWGDSFAQ